MFMEFIFSAVLLSAMEKFEKNNKLSQYEIVLTFIGSP